MNRTVVQSLIWIAAILSFGFGDTLTSILVFASGGAESNIVLGAVLGLIGPTIWGFIAIKVGTTAGVVLMARTDQRLEIAGSLLLLVVGTFLVAQNSSILFSS